MSDLSDGGNSGLGEWGYPQGLYNYETGQYDDGGMVWHGAKPATKADKKQCRQNVKHKPCPLDQYSLCGTDDPEWSTFRDEHMDDPEYNQHIKL